MLERLLPADFGLVPTLGALLFWKGASGDNRSEGRTSRSRLRLYNYHEVPHHQQGNPYIIRGYRAYLNTRECILSLWMLSNETVNVWSHLLGLVWAIAAAVDDAALFWSRGQLLTSGLIFVLYLIGVMVCMVMSATYHLFTAHNEKMAMRWLQLDLMGISVGIISCYLPGVYFAFYCQPAYKLLYSVAVVALAAFNVWVQRHPKFTSDDWEWHRIAVYSAALGFGMVPTAHWALESPNPEETELFVPRIAASYAIMVLGVSFFISRYPERCCPGACDFFGSSHQWWHICVLAGYWYWHSSCLAMSDYRELHPCPVD